MSTLVWAHRGASGYVPENTLEAFEKAAEMGADGVELDVQMTRDGELVVIHDETLDRTSDGSGFVKDYTLQELKRLNAGKLFRRSESTQLSSRFEIPTLQEVYELLKPTGLTINTELKTGIFFYEGIEEKVLDAAAKLGMADRIWYSSFNHYSIRKVKELDSSARTGVLYADGIFEAPAYGARIGVDAMHPALYNVLYPHYMEEVRNMGLKVHVWTVNEEEHLRMMYQMGVDAVITNYPDRACRIREQLQGIGECRNLKM